MSLDPVNVQPAKAIRLLGSGFAFTEFLIAPANPPYADRPVTCSLGAIAKLAVVICDDLLDLGESAEQVLPFAEIDAGGGESSIVARLMRLYYSRLIGTNPDDALLRTIRDVVRRMMLAELGTVQLRTRLSYRFWLQKCALPFVLMGLPVWRNRWPEPLSLYRTHIRWLYGIGRFLGAVDDAADFDDDARTGQPNCWRMYDNGYRLAFAGRAAGWGAKLLEEWDSLVPKTGVTLVLRETFLQIIWGSLAQRPP